MARSFLSGCAAYNTKKNRQVAVRDSEGSATGSVYRGRERMIITRELLERQLSITKTVLKDTSVGTAGLRRASSR